MSTPHVVAQRLCQLAGPTLELEFKLYKQNVSRDAWECRFIQRPALNTGDFHLKRGEEAALTSWCGGKVQGHIPMIDFLRHMSAQECVQWGQIVAAELAAPVLIFASGQSFHAYGLTFLSKKDWPAYLAWLLLLDGKVAPEQSNLVDQRWIAHSILQEASALRWTNATGKYRQVPQLVAEIAAHGSVQWAEAAR